jgi:hypothetical protein
LKAPLRLRVRAGIGRTVNRFKSERGSSHRGSEHFFGSRKYLRDRATSSSRNLQEVDAASGPRLKIGSKPDASTRWMQQSGAAGSPAVRLHSAVWFAGVCLWMCEL